MITNDCVEWDRATVRGGYGRVYVKGTGRQSLVHRLVWEEAHGPIPAGMCVLHRCDNPPCFNGDHLFLGTNADNVADKLAKGRQAAGERQGAAKLTAAQVLDIRVANARGASLQSLARRYGVRIQTIHSVVERKTWTHLGRWGT